MLLGRHIQRYLINKAGYLFIEFTLCHLGQGAGISIAGRIESGHVQTGESVLLLPANELVSVRGKEWVITREW